LDAPGIGATSHGFVAKRTPGVAGVAGSWQWAAVVKSQSAEVSAVASLGSGGGGSSSGVVVAVGAVQLHARSTKPFCLSSETVLPIK
jgi:hypothetical protein